MDSKLILVNCITLLFREAETEQVSNSGELCLSAMENLHIPTGSSDVSTGKDTVVGLKHTVEWMVDNYPSHGGFDKRQILQRVRVNTRDDTALYHAVEQGIADELSEEENQRAILDYRGVLLAHIDKQTMMTTLTKCFHEMNFNKENLDYREFARNLYSKLEPYTHASQNKQHHSIVASVDFADESALADNMLQSQEEMSTDSIIKTGYQAVNRMLGDHGGIRRGEFVLVGALQHNFKTGFAMNLFKHAALYNTPKMRDPNKKPLLMHISLENELPMNTMWLYKNLYENETGEIPDITGLNPAEASQYIKKQLEATGYNIVMMRLKPDETTFHDLFDIMTSYEAKGYEIHMVVCDYLAMISKKGLLNTGPTGAEIRDLFRRMRNFTAPRGIAFVTPHQLSTEAKNLTRTGIDNFVSFIANKGYYDSCKTIDQEVDLEIAIHIEKVGDESFLTMQRGKHRKVSPTPQKDLYAVMPFQPAGGVRDDINGKDSSSKTVGVKGSGAGGGSWMDGDF